MSNNEKVALALNELRESMSLHDITLEIVNRLHSEYIELGDEYYECAGFLAKSCYGVADSLLDIYSVINKTEFR